jgi:hypothetical protein
VSGGTWIRVLHSNALEGATKHSVQSLEARRSISRYVHVYSSTVRFRSSLLKMLQSAVVSIAFLAVLGQGQTSMLHRHHD